MARPSNAEAEPLEVIDSPHKRQTPKSRSSAAQIIASPSPAKRDNEVEDLFANLTLLNAVAFDSDDDINNLKPLPNQKPTRKPRAAPKEPAMPKARPQRRKAAPKKYYSDDDDEEDSSAESKPKTTATPGRRAAPTAPSTSRRTAADQPYPATPSRNTRTARSSTPMGSDTSEVGSLLGSKTPGIMKGGRRLPSLFDDEDEDLTPRRRPAFRPAKPRLYEDDEDDGQLAFLQGFKGLKGAPQATNLKKSLAELKRDLDVNKHHDDHELEETTARNLKTTARADDGFKDIDFKKPQFTTPRSKGPVHPPKSNSRVPPPPALKKKEESESEQDVIVVQKPPVHRGGSVGHHQSPPADDESNIYGASHGSTPVDSDDDDDDDDDDEPIRRPTRKTPVVPDDDEEEEESSEMSELSELENMSDSDADPVAAQLMADAAAAARKQSTRGQMTESDDDDDDDESYRTPSPEPVKPRRSVSIEVQIPVRRSKQPSRLPSTAHSVSERDDSDFEEGRSVGDKSAIDSFARNKSREKFIEDELFGSNSADYISRRLSVLSVKDTKKPTKQPDIITLSDDDENDADAFVVYEGPSLSPTKPRKPSQTTKPAKKIATSSTAPGAAPEPTMRTATKSKVEAPNNRSPAELRKFKKNREELANQILFELEAKVLVGEYAGKAPRLDIEWSETLRKTAGTAKSSRTGRSKITLSKKVIDDETRLWNTLAHEYCHVLNWVFDHHNGHGKSFYKWADIVMKHFPNLNITTCHSYEIQYKYVWQCTLDTCQQQYKRHSASIDPARQRCGRCQSKIVQILPVPKAAKALSEYQIFMKEEMARMKRETGKADMGEVAKRWKVESARRKAAAASAGKDDGRVEVRGREVVALDDDPVESVRTGFSARIDLTED